MQEQTIPSSKNYGKGAEELLDKLRQSLQRDGDFPASAKIVNELKSLTYNPKTTANQITEIILREPSLGARVLNLVNSSFYRRAKPIMTVSQAVVQIGMRPLAELCASLVLLQKFVPVARRGGPFATCLQKSIVTSLVTSQIGAADSLANGNSRSRDKDEQGFLLGCFSELGALLLAYYFPKIYESAAKRSETKNVPIEQSIRELTGLAPIQLSIEVLKALNLPEQYQEILLTAQTYIDQRSAPTDAEIASKPAPFGQKQAANPKKLAKHVVAAQSISDVIVTNSNKAALDRTIETIKSKFNVDSSLMISTISAIPTLFKDHCNAVDINLPTLPAYVSTYGGEDSQKSQDNPSSSDSNVENSSTNSSKTSINFMSYIEEIRHSVENREPTASVITSVMETLAWSLNFDRVILLLIDPTKTKLIGRMSLGNIGDFNPNTLQRPFGTKATKFAPDALAFSEARAVFVGEPLLKNGWPLTAIPIGYGQRALGVIYADRVNSKEQELNQQEQAAIGMLAELLDRSIGLNASA